MCRVDRKKLQNRDHLAFAQHRKRKCGCDPRLLRSRPASELRVVCHILDPNRPPICNHFTEEARFDRESAGLRSGAEGIKPGPLHPAPNGSRVQMLLAAESYPGVAERPTRELTHPVYCKLHCLCDGGCLVSCCGNVFQ